MTEVKQWRSCAALVGHRSNVYLVGGEEEDTESPTGSRTVNRVTRYDCETLKWSSAPSMNLARRWAAGVVLEDTLYVIGEWNMNQIEMSCIINLARCSRCFACRWLKI